MSIEIVRRRKVKSRPDRDDRCSVVGPSPAQIRLTIEYSCRLALATVSAVENQPLQALCALTRSASNIAFARQVAMYLAHTKFGIPYADVGAYFKRDRSTIAHACQLIEARRDDVQFDEYLSRMEYLIDAAIPSSPDIQQYLAKRFVGGVS